MVQSEGIGVSSQAGVVMRALFTPATQATASPATHREELHQLDDGQVVMRHLDGDPQAFGTLVDRYQTRLLNFVNRTIADPHRPEHLVPHVSTLHSRPLPPFHPTPTA